MQPCFGTLCNHLAALRLRYSIRELCHGNNIKMPPGEKRMGINDILMCGTSIHCLHSLESVTRQQILKRLELVLFEENIHDSTLVFNAVDYKGLSVIRPRDDGIERRMICKAVEFGQRREYFMIWAKYA